MDIEMENSVISFDPFAIGGMQIKYDSSKCFEGGKGGNKWKQTHFYGTECQEESGNIGSLCSDREFYQENTIDEGLWLSEYQRQSPFSDYGSLDDFHLQTPVSPLIQPCLVEIAKSSEILTGTPDDHLVEPKKENQYPFCLASLEILNNYRTGLKRLNAEKTTEQSSYDTTCKKVGHQELSTEEIMRVAGEIFIHSYSKRIDGLSTASHPFGSCFYGLSDEEIKNLQLAELLLTAAEKVGYQQFNRASRLLDHCDTLSSNTGNLVQRVVYYFSEALRERINRQTERITSKDLRMKPSFDLDEVMRSENPTNLACHQGIPFYQVALFTGIQAIVENVAGAKKVHIIDFAIRHGMQWTVLIQALAARDECRLELLKITAVRTTSKQKIEDTGKRLQNFAKSMNLPFSFKIVLVSPDMLDLREDLFESEAEEAIAVYCPFLLKTMIVQPNRLGPLMSVIRNINPCIVVVIEVEANHNSTAFVNRFIETLFFFSAYFDCLETCMDPDDPNKKIVESMYFGNVIRNIVATEGEERTFRHVKIDVWRAFFKRYGMVERELSMSSLYQASLVVKEFACGSSCTLDMDEKSLIIGWKGTPMHSLSAWKFLS